MIRAESNRKEKSSKKNNIADHRFPLEGRGCSETIREKFDTSTRYNVATQLQGSVEAADGSLKDESTGKIKNACFKIDENQMLLRCQYYLWIKNQRTHTFRNFSIFNFQDYCYAHAHENVNIKRGLCKVYASSDVYSHDYSMTIES